MKSAHLSIVPLLLLALTVNVQAKSVSPETVAGATTVNTQDAKALFDKEVAFVDPRKNSDWEAGRVPGAIHLDSKSGDFNEAALAEEVGKNEAVVFYCNGHGCLRSSKVAKMAVDWGYSKVYYYRDGFPAWKAANLPVE